MKRPDVILKLTASLGATQFWHFAECLTTNIGKHSGRLKDISPCSLEDQFCIHPDLSIMQDLSVSIAVIDTSYIQSLIYLPFLDASSILFVTLNSNLRFRTPNFRQHGLADGSLNIYTIMTRQSMNNDT